MFGDVAVKRADKAFVYETRCSNTITTIWKDNLVIEDERDTEDKATMQKGIHRS